MLIDLPIESCSEFGFSDSIWPLEHEETRFHRQKRSPLLFMCNQRPAPFPTRNEGRSTTIHLGGFWMQDRNVGSHVIHTLRQPESVARQGLVADGVPSA